MKDRVKIQPTMSMNEVVVIMADGNPGAVRVIMEMMSKDLTKFPKLILKVDSMGLRGESIWVGYKYHCNSNIDSFIENVEQNDSSMLDTIKSKIGDI